MSNIYDYPEPKEEYTFSDAVSDAIERNTYKQDYLDYIVNNFDEWLQDNGVFDNYEKFVSDMVQYSEEQYRDYERERAEMIKEWD
jgi:tryptophanase